MKKRLRKVAEFYNADHDNGDYIECFKNPTQKEWEIASNFKEQEGVRAIITENGETYCWTGWILHSKAIQIFNLPQGLNISGGIHLNMIEIYAQPFIDPQYMKKAFANSNSFFNAFSDSTEISEINTKYYKADFYHSYDNFKRVGDILNYNNF